jgi:Protein of unknown function (DUF1553)/Protein of unknown function (DUF1549)
MRLVYVLVGLALPAPLLFAAEAPHVFTPAQKNYWFFQPVKKPLVPAVKNKAWVKTPIDAFILAKLEENRIQPNPRADKLTLLRRVSIDMTGLPPTQEEIQAFLTDNSPNAWEKVVDRLLASSAYGERWGRHWLDVARYADSNGFKADETRPNVWRYRDYVIKAFNDDKPYDRFVKEQIAGDELYPGNQEALIAMGFNRHWIDETNAPDLFERRHQTLDDMTTVTGVAFLGMTFGCAKCHDHKFDPILTKDYYRLQAFFANTAFGDGPLPLADPEAKRKYDEQYADWDAKTKDIRAEMEKIMAPILEERKKHSATVMTDEVQAVVAKDAALRTPLEQQVYHIAETRFGGLGDPVKSLKGDNAKRYAELKSQLATFDSIKPPPLPEGQFMQDLNATAPPTYILHGGSRFAPGDEVQPGFLSILDPSDAKIAPPTGIDSTGRRSVLANWLTDPSNPLPARVMVNRIWHYHFGRGIVATPGDFGKMGARPTHPELLDYLASYFVDNGWSIKKVHRLILLSNAYQEASDYQPQIAEADPDNKLLWRYPRHRMEAEAIRDSMLATAGVLNPQAGGPGVYPPVPPGMLTELSATAVAGGWRTEKDPAQSDRRSVYIFVRRNLPYPLLQEFDTANTFESCDYRKNTVTAPQSLDLLNNELVLDWARGLAGRVLNDSGLTPSAQVDRAFRLAYGRGASADEQKIAEEFLAKQTPIMGQRLAGDDKTKPSLPANLPQGMDTARAAAFVDLCHILMDSNEFLYIN